jgi:hypothetical protein
VLNKIPETPPESPFYILSRNMMSPLQHTLRNTLERVENTPDAQVMQLHAITLGSGTLKKLNVRLSAKCAFEGKAFLLRDTAFDFAQ